ncbi:MAG TPA: hypothetical protein VH684_17125 [Xanthobacteraceae bacterium]|jgi:uncharacterized phage infection (PIP) family protein YhgE
MGEKEQGRDTQPGGFWEESGSAAHDLKSKAGQAAEPLKEEARGAVEAQKEAGADQLTNLSAAVHGAAGEIAKELPQAAAYIHSAADSLQSASSALRERSIEDLVSGFNDFARKQPAAAFAGSVLAGFALSRFLKSSKTGQPA